MRVGSLSVKNNRKNISVSYTSSGYEPVCILADQLNTQKLFLNLLNNAVKYTPPGGTISIETETETKNQITKRKARGKKGLTIDKDNASVGTGLNI